MEQLIGALAGVSVALAGALAYVGRELAKAKHGNGNGHSSLHVEEHLASLVKVMDLHTQDTAALRRTMHELANLQKDVLNSIQLHEQGAVMREDAARDFRVNAVGALTVSTKSIEQAFNEARMQGHVALTNCPVLQRRQSQER